MDSLRKLPGLLLMFAFVVCFQNGEISAQQPAKIFIGEAINVRSEILDEDRTLYIYTPAGYNSTSDGYPVLYMLDGADHFVHVAGIIHYLSAIGHIPQMIMVAIPNTGRIRDLSPTQIEEFPASGGGDTFLNFLDNELISYIDQNYRTQPYRVLAGHSLAGTFVIHTLISKPELFGGYIAISPGLNWDNAVMVDRAKSFFNKQPRFDNFLYITVADENDQTFSSIEEFVNTIRRTRPDDFVWEFVHMNEESHGSIPHKSVYDGLELLYEDWAVPDDVAAAGLESVLNHYRRLSDRFGYTVSPSEPFLNNLGYQFLYNRDLEEALKIFEHNVQLYPNSANVYDSYGEALERDGQLEKALENYRIAYTKGQESSDPNLNIYKQNYESLKARLENQD